MSEQLTTLLKEAAHKSEQMDYGTAIQLYQKALTLAPSNAGAAVGLVMVYNRLGRSREALALLEKMWPAARDAKGSNAKLFRATVLAQTGLAQQQLGQLGAALGAYTQAQQLTPNPDLQQRIERLQTLLGNPEPVQQLLLLGQQQQGAGQLDQALQSYSAALQLQASNIEALRLLAGLHRQRKAPGEAMPLLQKALILAPDRADLYNDLGMVFQELGDFAKAVSFHKRALKVAPQHVPALVNLGVACKRQGKNDEAVTAYRKALELQPNSAAAHNNLGNLLRVLGQLDEARQHLERALALQPDYADAQANLNALLQALPAPPASTTAAKRAAARKATRKTASSTPAAEKKPTRKKAPEAAAKAATSKTTSKATSKTTSKTANKTKA